MLIRNALDNAKLKGALGQPGFCNERFEELRAESHEFLMDLGVFELVLLGIFEYNAVFFQEVQKRVPPDWRNQVLFDKIIDPHVFLRNLILPFFFSLRFLFFAASENPIKHP